MKRAVFLALAVAVLATGCETVRYQTDRVGGGAVVQQTAPFFLFGLVGEYVVNLDALCPHGPARWYSHQTFLDGFLNVVTLGIYTPRTVVVECAGGGAYRLSPEDRGYRISSVQPPSPRG